MYCYFVLWCVSCYALFPRVATILERRILFEFGGGILIESWRWLAKSFSFNLSSSRMKALRDVTQSDVDHFDGGDECIACDCRCLDYFTSLATTKMSNYGQRAFSFAGPYYWNSLPDNVRNSVSIASFKRAFKTFLFCQNTHLAHQRQFFV